MQNSLSANCVKRVGPLVDSLASVVRELVLMDKKADIVEASRNINTTLETMLKMKPNNSQQNKIVDAFTTWRREVADALQATNKKAWESLITALDVFKEEVGASGCNEKDMPILKSIVNTIMSNCPYSELRALI